jgi:short-subunit dehydrogenase
MTALITGASSGIGAATARLMASQGTPVGIVGRRAQLLEAVLADCRAYVPDCRMWVLDLGDLDVAEKLADEAWDHFDGLDVLVNNAAVPKRRDVRALTPDEVEQVMRINYLSPVRLTLRLLPRMLAAGRGVIVNVASLGGRLGIAHEAAYCASKFALSGWSEAIAMDLHDTPVKVRLVQPGAIDTDIWDRPGEDAPYFDGPKESPTVVASAIVEAIESDHFEHYAPDMKAVVTYKDSDIDSYIAMVASLVPGSE